MSAIRRKGGYVSKKNPRLKDLLLICVLVTVVGGISHYTITNPLGLSRLLYYFQAPLIQLSNSCKPDTPDWMEDIQGYAVKKMGTPASQLAYVDIDGEVFHCETGWKDGIFGDEPLQPDTRFRFASTTKPVTAIAILDLINRKRLSLDDRIVDLLLGDEISASALKDPRVGEITIAHLLSHRGGWDRERSQDPMFTRNVKPWCPYKPEELTKTSLFYDPGSVEAYSNLGYCLLGLVIEKITDKPFRDYIRRHFDLSETTLEFVDGPYLKDEVFYDFRNEDFYTQDYFEAMDFYALSSSAGLSGSALDLAVLVKKSLENEPLTILAGVKKNCASVAVQECFGYGTFRYQPSPDVIPLHIHGGKLPGASSAIILDPYGGVLVWMGAGAYPPEEDSLQGFYDYIREALVSVSPQ